MVNQTPKYVLIYALCMLAFYGSYLLMDGQAVKHALIFQIIVFWLLNELWFLLYALVMIVAGIFKWVKSRSDVSDASFWRYVRWCSISLLIAPIFIHALLYAINVASGGSLQEWLELPLSTGLFASSYLACVLLFVLAFPAKLMGIGVCNLLEPDFDERSERSESGDKSSTPPIPPAASSSLVEYGSQSAAQHEILVAGMMAADEELLLHTAPTALDEMKEAKQSFVAGYILMAVALLFSAVAVFYWSQASSALFRAIPVCAALAFGFAALPSLRARGRFNRILNHSDYYITSKALYLCRLGQVRVIRYEDKPRFALGLGTGGYGRIEAIEQSSLMGKLLGKIQPDSVSDVESYKGFQDALEGMVHIAQPQEVFELLQEQCQL